MRNSKVQKRKIEGDKIYKSELIAKFINRIMISGKKSVAEKLVYRTMENLAKDGDPVSFFEKAVVNVGPKQEIKARRVGGASYQIPMEVRGDRKQSLAIRWIVAAAQKRSNSEFRTFDLKLAAEIKDAVNNQGEAVKKRDTIQRMAEANKAFSHFRF